MAEDDVSPLNSEAEQPSFDFDEEAISALLDSFVETQTGPRARRVGRAPNPSDTGAQAAQRTVFQHRSRQETLPLVGDTREAQTRRIELLNALAERAVGSARARLLSSAAELHEQLGNPGAAAGQYEQALHADARDVFVLRALRRLAIQCEDWAAAATALEKEASLELNASERVSALKLLAGIQLSKLGDPAGAEQSATHATALQPGDFVACVLTASARLARGDTVRAAEALLDAAERWPQAEAHAVVVLHAAQLMENANAFERAKNAYARVLDLQPACLAAHLGMVRTTRGLGATGSAADLLHAASEHSSGSLAAALRRMAAGLGGGEREHTAAIALLDQTTDTPSLWTLAELAAMAGDAPSVMAALDAIPFDSAPEARAVSSARRARLHAEQGNQADFDRAAREAEQEPRLNAYLQAWKRFVAGESKSESEIRELLDAVSAEATTPSSMMVHSDDAARRGDSSSFMTALERELDGNPEQVAGGGALAVAEIADATGIADRRSVLLRAEERDRAESMIRRALLVEDDDSERCARRWVNEGEATGGARSAFAFTMGARLARPGSTAAIGACEAALTAKSDYWPALWELEDTLGSPEARAASATAQSMLDSAEGASDRIRAALWAPSASEGIAHAKAALNPEAPDPLLVEHLFEAAGDATEAAADLMVLAARHFDLVPHLERAAASYRWAGLPDRAAKILREASIERPDDTSIRVQRKDAELHASEFARLTDAAMRRAREATDDAERLGAFAAIAEVDRLARRDMQSARLTLQSIAEMRPEDVPTARALEWDALREHDPERIRSSSRRLSEVLPAGLPDRIARHRLLLELFKTDPDIMQADVDRFLRGIDGALEADPGLARQVLGVAYAKGDYRLVLTALEALEASLDDELERGALTLDAAHALQRLRDPERALAILQAAQIHPLAREAEARLLRAEKRWAEAACVFEDAAGRAQDQRRAASLWREAASIFEDELDDEGRAIDAWVRAADCDITYPDVYRRLAGLYRKRGQLDELTALTDARIDAGADTPTLVALLLEKARQRRDLGDLDGVIDALDECLELDPHHFAALEELVNTHRSSGDWQGAAEALIRIARLNRSTDEQVWAFSELAETYDVHLQDLPRAEASLRRVAKLAPTSLEPLDRLASVLSRQNKPQEAAGLLEQLVRRASNDAQARDYRIRLASAVEAAGQGRQAELILEKLRA
ncbi:MAG: hypothetical protein WCE62_02650, partial [Polyangiales bacterium]